MEWGTIGCCVMREVAYHEVGNINLGPFDSSLLFGFRFEWVYIVGFSDDLQLLKVLLSPLLIRFLT